MTFSPRHPLAGAYLKATIREVHRGGNLGLEVVVLKKATDLVVAHAEVPPPQHFLPMIHDAAMATGATFTVTSLVWIGLPAAVQWRLDEGRPQNFADPVEAFLRGWLARKALATGHRFGRMAP